MDAGEEADLALPSPADRPEDDDSSGDDFEFSPLPPDPNSAIYPVFNRNVPFFHGEGVPALMIAKKSRSIGEPGRRTKEAVGRRSQSDGKAKMVAIGEELILSRKESGTGGGGAGAGAAASCRAYHAKGGGTSHAKAGGGSGVPQPQQRHSYLPYRNVFAGMLGGGGKGSQGGGRFLPF